MTMATLNTCGVCGHQQLATSSYCSQCGNLMPGLGTGLLPRNRVLQNRYAIVDKLGQGGMGAVYKVADQRLGGKVLALKEMSDAAITDPQERVQAIAAFRQEAQLLARLNHPNIPKVTDFFTENYRHYIVMEFVPGETLEDRLARQQVPCSEQEVRQWVLQLCEVLSYLHSQSPPIIFRDLKPGNIMLMPEGQLKLIDFGIARFFKPGKPGDTRVLGTPGYSPPEQHGRGQTDVRSDIYSLGVVLHRLLTLYDPETTPFKLPRVRQLNPAVSPQLEQIIAKATQPDILQRYQSVGQMSQTLRLGIPPSPLPRPVAYPRPMPRTWRGVPVWIMIMGIVLALGLGMAMASTIIRRPQPTPTVPIIVMASATYTPTRTPTAIAGGAVLPSQTPTPILALPTATPMALMASATHTPSHKPSTPTPTHRLPSSTPTRRPPTKTPTPAPYAVVTAETLNVRAGPGTGYDRIAQVRRGERLAIIGRNQACDWFKVKITGSKTGWVAVNYVDLNVAPCSPPEEPVPPTPTLRPTPSQPTASNTRDFSGSQGANHWWYQVEKGRNSGVFVDFPSFGSYRSSDGKPARNCWLTSQEQHVRICEEGEIHPGASGRIAYRWRSDVARDVRVVVHAHKIDTSCGNNDGVWIGTYRVPQGKPPLKVGEFSIRGAEYRDRPANTYRYDIPLNAGDSVMVMLDISRSTACDMTRLYVDIY